MSKEDVMAKITREWLEATKKQYFALPKAESDALLQWAQEAMERERRLKEALAFLLLGLAAAPIEAEMFTKYLWRPETNARVLLKELKEVPHAG